MKTRHILVAIAAVLALASCKPRVLETPSRDFRNGNSIVVNPNKQWVKSRMPAYIGDISAYPKPMQDVITERFPHQVGKDAARVLFVGKGEYGSDAFLAQAAEAGAFIVYPGDGDGTMPVLLNCVSGWGSGASYVMYDEPVVLTDEEGTPSMTESEWKDLVAINKGQQDDGGVSLLDYDNDPEHNLNYYQARLDPFVEWLDNTYMERNNLLTAGGIDYDNMKADIDQMGQRVTANYPFSLNKYIDKATGSDPDYLYKSGSISIEFRIFPLHMQSSNGAKAGDYYGVVSAITPHNQSMWGPYAAAHGWCRNRIYGYWFSGMDVATSLVYENGYDVQGLEYFDRPIPENPNSSKSYSSGKSTSISGTVSGGYTKVPGWGINGAFSAGGTWTSSTNYTLETINYMLDSSTPTVKYHYWSENVKLTDDWDDWSIINQNFPASVRSEFTSRTMWVWFIPNHTVPDRSTTSFRLKTKIRLQYSTWYHWRGSHEFDSNLANHEVNVPEYSWVLDRPDRTPWGFVRLRNASSNEMAHVSFFGGDTPEGEPLATLTTSYGKGDEARIALPEGKYCITWDIINGDSGQLLGRYIYKNVNVHQGADEQSATLRISSVDAEPLE